MQDEFKLLPHPPPQETRCQWWQHRCCPIGIVRNEHGRSLSREDQGGCRQVPLWWHVTFPIAISVTVAFATTTVVSCSLAGCHVDASASCPLDSASASQHATSAYWCPVASCPLMPLLPFASCFPAGCPVACCCMPPPCITFAAASRVHPQPPLFICASWLLHCISLHRLCISTCRHLTTGCVVAVSNMQASSPSMHRHLSHRRDCKWCPRCLSSSWHHCPCCCRCIPSRRCHC